MRVIALGQDAAGDDAVGLAVLAALRRREVPAGVELMHAADATALLTLLETTAAVVIVDAALGGLPGRIVVTDVDALAASGLRPLSSHGLGVAEVVAIARCLANDRIAASIRIAAITVDAACCRGGQLSPACAALVEPAADRVHALIVESAPAGGQRIDQGVAVARNEG